MFRILIVEDNKSVGSELSFLLSKNGYQCELLSDFKDVTGYVLKSRPHLVLLDINLPVYDGYYICRCIRRKSDVPIIVVTSRNSEIDELMSMNLGADDFITKPYNIQILLLRIASLLRRSYHKNNGSLVITGDCKIDLTAGQIKYKEQRIELTKNEQKILTCLIQKKGTIVSRDDLIRYLWQSDEYIDDNTLTVNVNRLRKKLEEAGLSHFIETRRGQGYAIYGN